MKRKRSPPPSVLLASAPSKTPNQLVHSKRPRSNISISDAEELDASSGYDKTLELPELLDFTSLSTDADISRRFQRISCALLREYRLLLNFRGVHSAEYEILELEFYLRAPGCHEDPFTHGSEEQKQSGRWYFHRVPRKSESASVSATSAAGYRGGTRKGLDLTIGTQANVTSSYFLSSNQNSSTHAPAQPTIYGGILLRSIRRMSDSKVISGPSLLVDEIVRRSGASTIAELVTNVWHSDISAFSAVSSNSGDSGTSLKLKKIVPADMKSNLRIYRSPRIGLDLSHPDIPTRDFLNHPRVIYVSRPYRYFVHPQLLTANGRGQTFLGVYRLCMDLGTFQNEKALCAEVERLTTLKTMTVVKYLVEYKRGHASGELRSFVGAAGKGASASPTTFLRMMGVLQRLQENPEISNMKVEILPKQS